MHWQDVGGIHKTIPYDQIQDIVIKEPAGSVCCCVQRVLTTVEVSSASANGPQLVIEGLSDPMSFRDNVLKCKRDIIMAAGVSTNSHDMVMG